MRQYVLPPSYDGEALLNLEKKDSQYFIKVLRLKKGDKIIARDNKGKIYQLILIDNDNTSCSLSVAPIESVEEGESTDSLPSFSGKYPLIHLFQCTCKGKKNDGIIRMATEMGVQSITLVQSNFCVSKKDNKDNSRFKTIIKEAIQQSGSPIPTTFNDVIKLEELPNIWKHKLLFFHQSELKDQKSLYTLLMDFPLDEPIGLLIGSEGGLSKEECNLLINSGFDPVLLKTNILRAETASIAAISAIHTLLMEK
ncbi:MAG: 16S rRNA (uracil(1498)-N(3))-methyltransferase [Spirochaetaceae bacterium]|nr:16S rRNA (uracil(1498)-N(3))-methyltransferase [Spirochaetaceae bacterium]